MKHIKCCTSDKSRRVFLTVLALTATVGIFIGSFFGAERQDLPSAWIHQYFYPFACDRSLFSFFLNDCASAAVFISAVFLFGLFPTGQPLAAVALVYRGFGAGLSAALLYARFGRAAVTAVLLLIIPKAIAYIYISMLAVREGIRSSDYILHMLIYNDSENTKAFSLKMYAVKYGVLILLSVVAAAADTAVNYLFLRFAR